MPVEPGFSDREPGRERRCDGTKPPRGFTLVEIAISAVLLSLLILTVFWVFQGSGGSFTAGSWQAQTQKQAQIFLSKLKELLEKANNADSFNSTGAPTTTPLEIMIQRSFLASEPVTLTGTVPLLFFSVTKAYNSANPLIGAPEKRGVWAGVTLAASKDPGPVDRYRLILIQSGTATDHVLSGPPYSSDRAGADFDPQAAGLRIHLELEDVSGVSISTDIPGTIEVKVLMSKRVSFGRIASFKEKILVKLIHPTQAIGDL